MQALTLGMIISTSVLILPVLAFAKVETWRQEGATAFAKSHREGVVISDNGRIRLGHSVAPLGTLSAGRVWDLARTREGTLLAATGDAGQVFHKEPAADSAWTLAFDSNDSQVLSLIVCPNGSVFAGTGPNGQVVDLADPKHPTSRPDQKVQYIWDLAADAQSNVYAATGPNGQLWKRSREGRWSLLYDSKATHLLCLALAPDGSVYAGGDGEGLIYHISPEGKATVVFDAPQSEIRTLLLAPDGALYAGTAAEAGSGGSRTSMFLPRGDTASLTNASGAEQALGRTGDDTLLARTAVQTAPASLPNRPATRSPQGGSAAPRPISPGENAVYRLDSDGVPREILRVKALIHALAWQDDHLWVGTGPEGQLYEVRNRGDESAPIAKLDHGQILSLLAEPSGGILIGTGDPGSVLRLSSEFRTSGHLVSEVHDTKLLSRFGSITWRAEQPPGTAVGFQARTGNVGEPDETWSAWSTEQTDPSSARIGSPMGRFVQYRARLSSKDPRVSPELRSVSLNFRTSNLAPEISRLDVPDVSSADGAARQARLNIRWDATDPNEDDLNFILFVRKDGWPEWIRLTQDPIVEKTFPWDTTTFPSGSYRLKLIASDRPSNGEEKALTRERESLGFLVDHAPPSVRLERRGRGTLILLSDEMTRVVKAEYALDGGPWTAIFPDDGLFDSSREQITLSLSDLKPGTHLLMVRATDSSGNIGTGDALLEIQDQARK